MRKEFLQIAGNIKSFGYDVYIFNGEPYNYGYIFKGDNIIYFELGSSGIVRFRSVHKLCREYGGGFGIQVVFKQLRANNITPEVINEIFVLAALKYGSIANLIKMYTKEEFLNDKFTSGDIIMY